MGIEGRRRIAEGREAEIFEWGGDAVLKLFRSPALGYEAEAAALDAITTAHGPAPRLLERVEIDGRPGLVIERAAGTDMLAALERAPWRLVGRARLLATTHASIHEVVAPPGLPDATTSLDGRIRAAPLAEDLRSFALAMIEGLPDGDRLNHGDYHPGNVLVARGRLAVIDWTLASRGHPIIDVARTRLLLELGEPLAPSPWMRAVIRVGRGAFARVYRSTYARRAPVDPAAVERAGIVVAAARLWEGIPEEAGTLTTLLEEARARR